MGNKVQVTIVAGLIRDTDGRIFLQKRVDELYTTANGRWEFPGGKIEFGELPQVALVRECQEEIGCEVNPLRLLPHVQSNIWERQDGATQALVLCYEAEITSGTPVSTDPKVSEVGFFTDEEVKAMDTLPGIKELVQLAI